MIMECSYAVTAWTQAVEDEHRLLSQVLAILFAYPEIPAGALNGRLASGSQAYPIKGRIGQGKGEKSDFWSAVGGQYKVSLDYVVRLSVDSGAQARARPGGPHADHSHASDRRPRAPSSRCTAPPGASRQEGRAGRRRLGHAARSRRLDVQQRRGPLPFRPPSPGPHRLLARTADGREADAQLEVPGAGVDLVMG